MKQIIRKIKLGIKYAVLNASYVIMRAGLIAYYRWSFKGMWKTVRAKFVFYDCSPNSVNRYLANGIVFQMWHGIPMKKIGWDMKGNREGKAYKKLTSKGIKRLFYKMVMPYLFRKENWIVVTSKTFRDIMSSAFDIDKEKIIITGHPRNDDRDYGMGATIETDTKTFVDVYMQRKEGKKIIMYMPTFRDREEKKLKDIFVLGALDNHLEKMNAIMVMKLHLASKAYSEIKKYKNIYVCDNSSDAQPFLKLVDLLITDYSGVYFDFLLLDRPVIFYAYDITKYIRERGLYFDYKDICAGYISHNFYNLLEVMEKVLFDKIDDYIEARKNVLDICFSEPDSNSSIRLVNWVFNKYKIRRSYEK